MHDDITEATILAAHAELKEARGEQRIAKVALRESERSIDAAHKVFMSANDRVKKAESDLLRLTFDGPHEIDAWVSTARWEPERKPSAGSFSIYSPPSS